MEIPDDILCPECGGPREYPCSFCGWDADTCAAPDCNALATRTIARAVGNWRTGESPREQAPVHVCQAHEDEVMADDAPWPDWYLALE